MNKNRQRGGRPQGRRPHGNMNGTHRNFDSNGPDVKIRGTASHIFERYCQLARDANAAGDRVAAENYLQHAEHYYRIMLAQGVTPMQRAANGGGQQQPAQQAAQPQPSQAFADGEQPSLEMELEAALDPAEGSNGKAADQDEATAA
ncbi:MAG TPA: DUF4167 domain-containing protein [Ferrovibrio sp.]